MISTKDAPKTLQDLETLLKNDNKVKVAGKLAPESPVSILISPATGIDGTYVRCEAQHILR